MNTKIWYESKTIRTALAGIFTSLGLYFTGDMEVAELLLGVFSILSVYHRSVTTTGISMSNKEEFGSSDDIGM